MDLCKKSLCKKFITSIVFSGSIIYFSVITVFAANTAVVSADILNVRSTPSLDGAIVEKASDGQALTIHSTEGDWFKVDTSTAKNVYVSKEFVKITSADAVVSVDGVNIRSQATTSSEIRGTANSGMNINVTEKSGDFYSFSYNGQKSYIHGDYVNGSLIAYVEKKAVAESPANKPAPTAPPATPAPAVQTPDPEPAVTQQTEQNGVITTYALVMAEDGLNFRKGPDQNEEIILPLSFSEAVDVLEIGDQWHKVSYNGVVGYISADFSLVKTGVKPDYSIRTSLVNYAQQFLGTRYVWGGTDLKKGVDCSGFTYSVYKNFGIKLNRSSRDQIANGKKVSKSELVPGDLIFFDTEGSNNGNISHVGIYMGGGQFIHASSSGKSNCVTISSLSEAYYQKTYVSACRVL